MNNQDHPEDSERYVDDVLKKKEHFSMGAFFQSHHFLKVFWTELPKIRMPSFCVVKHFYIISDISPGFFSGSIGCIKYSFCFQTSEETFSNAIVPAVTVAAHAEELFIILQDFLKFIAAIPASPIRVENKNCCGSPTPKSHLKGIKYQLLCNSVTHS